MKREHYKGLLKKTKGGLGYAKAFIKEIESFTFMETVFFGFLVVLIIGVVIFGSGLILVLSDAM